MITQLVTSPHFYLIAFLAIYNIGLVWACQRALSGVSMAGALREKSLVTVSRVEETDGSVQTTETPAPAQDTSASRVALLIGGLVMAVFLWAVGNMVIYTCMTDPSQVPTLLDSIGNFFLAGSALFAPYAFNQLGSVFQRTAVAARP